MDDGAVRRARRLAVLIAVAVLSMPAPPATGAEDDLTGDVLVLSDGGNELRLVDPDDGAQRDLGGDGGLFDTDLAGDDRSVALAGDGGVEVRDLDTGGAWRPYSGGPARSVRWSPRADRLALSIDAGLAVVSADGTGFRVVASPDVHTVRGTACGDRPADDLSLAGWSPDGTKLLALALSYCLEDVTGDLVSVDVAGGDVRTLFTRTSVVTPPDVAPVTGTVAFERDGQVALLDLAGQRERTLGEGSLPRWSPREGRLAWSRRDGTVVVWDGDDTLREFTGSWAEQVVALTWSPDSRRLLVVDGVGGHVLDLHDGGTRRLDLGVVLDSDWVGPATRPTVVRSGGADRTLTAAQVSARFFPAADHVTLARADDAADALSAAPLAGLEGGPVLLTWPDELPAATVSELERLSPSRITLVGGERAVSTAVEEELRRTGYAVNRIAGPDRYATSAGIAARLPDSDEAFLASGTRYADALALGPLAAARRIPILLAAPDGLPDSVARELARRRPDRVFVAGGSAAVAESVEEQARQTCGCDTARLAGADRTATATVIADEAVRRGLSAERVFLAGGDRFADALAAAPAAAAAGGPLLLTAGPTSLGDATAQWLSRSRGSVARVDVLGDRSVLDDRVGDQARSAAAP